MRFALIICLMTLAGTNASFAKVTETKKPAVETPSVQSELMQELDTAPEDVDFDSDDQLMMNVDEDSLIIDAEIERIAVEDQAPAATVEAKAPVKTEVKKK